MDPGTAGVVRDYENSLPSGLRSGQLNFESTRVGAQRWNELVGQEGGDVGKFNSAVNELGGPDPKVTQTPILLRSDKGEFGTASLFQVKGADGQTHLVDSQGANYSDMTDYLEHNQLDESWTMARPASLGDPGAGAQQLVSGPAHNTTTWQKVGKVGDKIAEPMVAAGSALVGGAAVAEVTTLGAATPVAGTAAAIGGTMMAVGGGWMAIRSSGDLIDRYQHGRNLSLADPQARADYLGVLGGAGGALGAAARSFGAASVVTRAADGTVLGAGGAMTADQAGRLYHDWDKLSPDQRGERLGQVALDVGLLRRSSGSREGSGSGSDFNSPANGVVPNSPHTSHDAVEGKESPSSPLAPDGGLQVHENAGGHVLDPDKAHVGASDQEMLSRLDTDPSTKKNGVSSFYDRATAERAVHETIESNKSAIDDWLKNRKAEKSYPFATETEGNVGRRVDPGTREVTDVRGAKIVLKRDSSMPSGYHVLTAYPTP